MRCLGVATVLRLKLIRDSRGLEDVVGSATVLLRKFKWDSSGLMKRLGVATVLRLKLIRDSRGLEDVVGSATVLLCKF